MEGSKLSRPEALQLSYALDRCDSSNAATCGLEFLNFNNFSETLSLSCGMKYSHIDNKWVLRNWKIHLSSESRGTPPKT